MERLVSTPHGDVTVHWFLGDADGVRELACLQRFDSRDAEDIAERMLGSLPSSMRNDAGGPLVYARGLEHIMSGVYDLEFPEFKRDRFIPVNTEVPPGSLSFTYRMTSRVGRAKIIHNYASDLPTVELGAKEFPSPIVTLGVSYNFSIVDLQRAALQNISLETLKADAARWAIEYLMEEIACKGAPDEGVPGLINAPGVTSTAQVSTGTWTAQLNSIAAATAEAPAAAVAVAQALSADINAMVNGVADRTNGKLVPDMVLLPSRLFFKLRSVPRSPAFTNDNLLDYFRNLCDVEVDFWTQLNDAGAGGTGRAVAYKRDPSVLRQIVAQPFTQTPPQARNLAFQVPCLAQVGGTQVLQPAGVTYMDSL